MLTRKRIKTSSVIQGLQSTPKKYSFTQAVKLVECHYSHAYCTHKINPFELFDINTPPHLEPIRFTTTQKLIFPESDITNISKIKVGKVNKWQIQTSFMGLTGPSGVLPFHYSELVNDRKKKRDNALLQFFDYFNHRSISLFYQASVKYHYPIEFERRNKDLANIKDTFTIALLSLCGLGTEKTRNRMLLNDLSIAYYSGLFSQRTRTKFGLKSILSDYFNVKVNIKEMTGGWCALIDEARTILPSKFNINGNNSILGKTTILGNYAHIPQSKFSVYIGPISYSEIDKYGPGSDNMIKINELIRLYTGPEYKYDIYLKVKFIGSPEPARFGRDQNLTLGWNTWLMSSALERNNKTSEHTLKIK